MAESMLMSRSKIFIPKVTIPAWGSPREANTSTFPDPISTPRSYFASLSSPSSPFSGSSPRQLTTTPRGGVASCMSPSISRISSSTSRLDHQRRRPGVSDAFVWPTQQRPTISHDDFTTIEIPTVDLARLHEATNSSARDYKEIRKQIVSQVRDACRDWGFFHVVNHGVPVELLDRVQKQARRFFSLPKDEKLKVQRDAGSITGYGHAAVKPTDSQPWSEGFYLANDSTVDRFAQILWPHGNNQDFSNSYREYNEMVENLAKNLMSIIIEGLGVNEEHFVKYLNNSSGLLRWNHYPPCPQPHKTLGMSAHTDFNLLTVLHQGEIGGLQVEKDGKWIAVKPQNDALAINIGDTLQVLTNGLYKSIPHRAVVNRSQARISLAYFFAPSLEAEVVACPELIQADKGEHYKHYTLKEYLVVKRGQLLNTLDHFALRPLLRTLALPLRSPPRIPIATRFA